MQGRRVVVSGGGTGIGKATAMLFARLGAEVAICGRRMERLAASAALIEAATGRRILTRAMSIRDPEAVAAFVGEVHDTLGGIDVLVNNAGGQFPQASIDLTPKGWLSVIDTNLNGTWWMMQAAAREWRDRGQPGSIANVVCLVERGSPQVTHTIAARARVIYASKSLALEWAPYNIRVNCLAPGAISTEGFRMYPEEALRHMATANPMKRASDAFSMAETLVYMASPAADLMNGAVMTVDGGMTMWGVGWPAGRPAYFAGGE
ncbi:SDR family oxidoreductase [Sphingomonas profundi]|uniref:SDR family oxidoreductase n=1 Tax=Alterirhizorhabdus profundi TaxID=2681549 RepID=UPI0012E7F436|nr:SDR family oxidoreductase [Sphingomonas profundi]